MNYILNKSSICRALLLFILFYCVTIATLAQTQTTIKGFVIDSVTDERLSFATVQFDQTSIGVFTDSEGYFKLIGRPNNTYIVVSLVGYQTKKIRIPQGKTGDIHIHLSSSDQELKEVIVRPKKEKYSKKNNPAVELIEKVIANKKQNSIKAQDFYQYKEYDRTVVAINEFNPDLPQFKRYKFLPQYADSSLLDNKKILPVSVREKISDVYFRKDPKSEKRIVHGSQVTGIDQVLDTEGLDAIMSETFKEISLVDNSITLLFREFIGPLSNHQSVNFYKWYIMDTINIDNKKYINLSFAPFNARDVGFTGALYISTDSTYAIKRAILRTPKKMNINFVDEMIIHQEFTQNESNVWIPKEFRMAIDFSLIDAIKVHVDKTQTFEDVKLGISSDSIYNLPDPVSFGDEYYKRPKDYWTESRPSNNQKDYRMDKMVEDMRSVFLFRLLFDAGNIISSGRFPLTKDAEKNKLEIGTIPTFYSFNQIEGNRLRLSLNTTKDFHPRLFLQGYAAYGTKDEKFKYQAEATWAMKNRKRHKDEFPKNNITIAYKYDLNTLGQRHMQAERDNILMSFQTSKNAKLTYNNHAQIMYNREYHNGFAFEISAQNFNERPAGNLQFIKIDENRVESTIDRQTASEISLTMRYAPNEKFFQQRRKRHQLPTQKTVFTFTNTKAFKDVFGSQFSYTKSSLIAVRDQWIAPYGKLKGNLRLEKLWGEAPFTLLLSPSANSTFTIQRGSFYLIEPLEFVHDSQVSWEVYYHMDGWFFNRVPFLKALKFREVFGFRGFYGELSNKNNPKINHNMLVFPKDSYTTINNRPYMECNVGIENIFKFFRIDYVRRMNYLNHPNINKDGFRITFNMAF